MSKGKIIKTEIDMPILTIDGKVMDVPLGITILDAALNNNIEIDHNCGGNCACSTCQIVVDEGMENISPMRQDEADMLEDAPGRTSRSRLACQSQVMGDIKIKIPPEQEL